jgi:hypothetical protein
MGQPDEWFLGVRYGEARLVSFLSRRIVDPHLCAPCEAVDVWLVAGLHFRGRDVQCAVPVRGTP